MIPVTDILSENANKINIISCNYIITTFIYLQNSNILCFSVQKRNCLEAAEMWIRLSMPKKVEQIEKQHSVYSMN